MTAPDVVGVSHGVLLQGQALIEASRLISWAVKELRRRDGIHAPRLDRLEAVLRAEATASTAAGGHAIGPADGTAAAFTQDLMSTEEVAEAMGISTRHVTRQAAQLGGRKIAGVWAFDPVIVHAAATERERTQTSD
jgi:hypothetical protein